MEAESQIYVSVVIPVYNEENYIKECIESVVSQDYPKEHMELVLVDGGSDDNTVDIIKSMQKDYPFIRLLNNSQRTVQHALNIGMKNSVGNYIVRMDAHSEFASDYVSKSIHYLETTDAANVGGPVIAKGKNPTQKAVAAAFHSAFALGGGKNHEIGYEGYSDTVFAGAFRRETLEAIDFYDERLVINEDDDLNFRLQESGQKIFITPEIKSVYYPRSRYIDVFKQYYRYGLWKVAVIKKHKKPARISHLVPITFVLYLIIFGILSCFFKPFSIAFLAINSLYLICDIYFSFTNKQIDGIAGRFRLLWIHFIIHISYGTGFLFGIFKFARTKF